MVTPAQRIKDLERINAALQNEVHWLNATIYNPSFNEIDIRLMVELTPWGVKAGILSPDEADEKKLYYPALATKAHCSEKVASTHVRTLSNKAGAFSYRRDHSVDEETEQDITRVYLAPKEPAATPSQIDLARARRGGSTWKDGKRIKRCPDCKSPVVLRRSQYWCQNPDCLHMWETPWKPINNTDDMLEDCEDEDEEANCQDDTLHEDEAPEPEPEEANSHIDVLPGDSEDVPPTPTRPVYTHVDGSFEKCAEPHVAIPVLASVYRNPDLLPELKKRRLWALGRATWNEKKQRWDKEPFIADLLGTTGASHSDPSTWRSFGQAIAVYEKWLSWENPFTFLMVACDGTTTFTDQDHCRNPETGEITPEAMERARRISSYTEPSYSEAGLHHLSWGTVPAGRKNEKLGVEMYSQTRFCALTGQPLAEFPQTMKQRQEEVNALYKELFPPKPEPLWDLPEGDAATDEELARVLEAARNASNAPKFHRLMAGDASDYPHKNGTPDYSRADQALCTMFVYWCRRVLQKASKDMIDWLFRKSQLCDAKWEREDYRNSTIAQAFAYVGVAA